MSLDERIESLRVRHAALDDKINQENQRPHPDDLLVLELKREKLRIKDQITAIEHRA